MNSTKPPSSYPSQPVSIDNVLLDGVGLTEAYRNELDELTRYLGGVSNDDSTRLLLNTIEPLEKERFDYEVEVLQKLGIVAIDSIRQEIGEYFEGMTQDEQELAIQLLLNR